jgi:putative FmdB family regulatory protein
MPIYEYACKPCGKVFEELILRKADEAAVACPVCKSKRAARVMSRTAASRPAGGGGGGPAPSCGPVG